MVYSLLLRLTASPADADDLGQETFLRAYKALQGFPCERRAELEPKPWLTTIATNVWRNHLRHRSRRPQLSAVHDGGRRELAAPDRAATPEDQVVSADGFERLAALVARLPDHQRLPIVLRHVAGLGFGEIADTLQCPVGTAKANASRGMVRLRALVQQQDGTGR